MPPRKRRAAETVESIHKRPAKAGLCKRPAAAGDDETACNTVMVPAGGKGKDEGEDEVNAELHMQRAASITHDMMIHMATACSRLPVSQAHTVIPLHSCYDSYLRQPPRRRFRARLWTTTSRAQSNNSQTVCQAGGRLHCARTSGAWAPSARWPACAQGPKFRSYPAMFASTRERGEEWGEWVRGCGGGSGCTSESDWGLALPQPAPCCRLPGAR